MRHKSAEYLALNPNGRIPTLVDGDLVLFETAAICLHLIDRHPDAGLAPAQGSPERSVFYQWLVYLTNTLQAEMLVYHYPHRHTTDGERNKQATEAVKAQAEVRLNAMFDLLDETLGRTRYLAGDDYSICDTYLLMVTRWGRMLSTPPTSRPNLKRVLDDVVARPAVVAAFESEGLKPAYA